MTTLNITVEKLRKLTPSAKQEILENIVAYQHLLKDGGINTQNKVAMFLAQAAHESQHFQKTLENDNGMRYENVKILGNIYSGDGPRFKGRGLFQITGRWNYSKLKSDTGLNVVKYPELLEDFPYALDSAIWFWNLRRMGDSAENGNVLLNTRKLNGGSNGLSERIEYFRKASVIDWFSKDEIVETSVITVPLSIPVNTPVNTDIVDLSSVPVSEVQVETIVAESVNPFYIEDDTIKSNSVSIEYHNTRKKSSRKNNPKFLVIHYTAGRIFSGDVRTLSSSTAQASCQIVIGKRGEIAQIGKLNDTLWHAGESTWRGYSGLNDNSIGIEVTCAGYYTWAKDLGNGKWKVMPHWRESMVVDEDEIVFEKHKNGVSPYEYWESFTPEQIKMTKLVGEAIMKHYKLEEAVGHDMISPKRKVDPGPCMPDSVYSYLNGRKGNGEAEFEPDTDTKDSENKDPNKNYGTVFGVSPDRLNMRRSPNGNPKGTLPEGTIVEILARNGNWLEVKSPMGYVGWVYGKYIDVK